MEDSQLTDKTIIITGANSGLGKHTARCLAQKGARLILTCRDLGKGNKVMNEIQHSTGNKNIIFKQLDMGSVASIREFCADFNKNELRLDILINNAGVLTNERHMSVDGHELMLAVNFLGPFLLTHLLLDKLRESTPSRIVNVTSETYEHHEFNFDDVQLLNKFETMNAYGRSKTALVMLTTHLAEMLKETGVTTYSLHPGVIQTGLMRDLPIFKNPVFRCFFPCLMSCCAHQKVLSIEEGCKTTLYCALDPSLATSGRHYQECKEREMKTFAKDTKCNQRLWDLACELCDVYNAPIKSI